MSPTMLVFFASCVWFCVSVMQRCCCLFPLDKNVLTTFSTQLIYTHVLYNWKLVSWFEYDSWNWVAKLLSIVSDQGKHCSENINGWISWIIIISVDCCYDKTQSWCLVTSPVLMVTKCYFLEKLHNNWEVRLTWKLIVVVPWHDVHAVYM